MSSNRASDKVLKMVRVGEVISKFRAFRRDAALFCLLVAVLSFFLAGVLLFLRTELQQSCVREMNHRIAVLVKSRQGAGTVRPSESGSAEMLQGLGFVRLMRDGSEVFFTDHTELYGALRAITEKVGDASLVWVGLEGGPETNSWVVVTQNLADGTRIQAGARFDETLLLYQRIRKGLLLLMVFSAAFSLVLVMLVRRRCAASLQTAQQWIDQGMTAREGSQAGEEKELVGLLRAIDRLIRQNNQLVKEMQESLDNVAHDLRTPMTRLRAVAEYGLQKRDADSLAEALSDCLEESDRVLSMLGIMMSVAEAESGTMLLHREAVPLSAIADDVMSLYEYVAEEKEIVMVTEGMSGILLDVDRTRMTQVWGNLVDNAIKYGKRGGKITIMAESSPSGDIVTIHFTDNGRGISPSEIGRIWERLFRGDRSRTEQGLGLGLNYVKAVVEAHGGTVAVSSELGVGSEFTIELPLWREPDVKMIGDSQRSDG